MASETTVSPDIARDTAASGSDQMIRWTTTVTVVVLGAIAAAISYRHMFILVSAYGEARWTAALLPISVDGMIVSSSMSLLADSRLGRRGGVLPWTLLVIGSAASLAANVAVAEPSVVGRLVAAWPSAALIGSYELLMRQIRHASRPATSLGRTRESATSTVRKPQMVASAQGAPSDRARTDEQVKDVRALPEQDRAPGHDQSHSGAPHGLTGMRYEAWNWALANRMGDGTLPPGRVIAERFGRSERWGRLVKRAGETGR